MSLNFIDWAREPGKTGRKDSYVDLLGGRLLRKVRTGMVFLQSDTWRIAAGPCEANDNQVINFINAQYMNDLQRHDWLICHAAGLVRGERAVAIAGFSGGGKSTVMLRAMEHPSLDYLTNDRLFIRGDEQGVQAAGIPSCRASILAPSCIVSACHRWFLRRSASIGLPCRGRRCGILRKSTM